MIEPYKLPLAISLLDSLYAGSDPYPQGVVKSLYYDSKENDCFQTCLEGNYEKEKYRLRWYDDQANIQAQIKTKRSHRVAKIKQLIEAKYLDRESLLNYCWHEVTNSQNVSPLFRYPPRCNKTLWPLIQINYHRRRYRAFDYRFTIDSSISATANPSHPSKISGSTTIPFAVLEIKTRQERPFLPFLGHLSLSQTSMSKFALSIHMLLHNVDALNKYVSLENTEI